MQTHPSGRTLARSTAALLGLALLWGALHVEAQVTARQLDQRIGELVAEVRKAQRADGAFCERGREDWLIGQTALCVLALRAAGVAADDPNVAAGVAYLAAHDLGGRYGVYQESLRVLAFQSVKPAAYRAQIARGAAYLIGAQQDSGVWSYVESGRTDYSNTQFALLGLQAAALSGADVPVSVWEKARAHLKGGQNRDGGWSYIQSRQDSYGSMTAAGVASMHICDTWLHVARAQCGKYLDDTPTRLGLDWLARHFTVTTNPGRRNVQWKFYYLYALERAGVILARRYFGRHDWYREGVQHLVGDDDRMVRATSANEWRLLQNAFMLLFLAKGNAPILIHKAQWLGSWQTYRYDAKFLVQFISDRLGIGLDWQAIPLSAPLEELMAAPILYLSGSGGHRFLPKEVARLKEYVDAGGAVLVEAAGGDKAFDSHFRRTVAELFPDEPMAELPKDHPIYTAYFDLPMGERPTLEAVKGPCWISVLYAPGGLGCPWDVADFDHVNFRLGANVAAYVTGMEKLEGKLVTPTFYEPVERDDAPRRGAFTVGQVVHAGEWQPHKVAWRRALANVSDRAGIEVYSRTLPISLDDESAFQAQMLYITGVGELALSDKAKAALRTYLERGGFIFAEAACGSKRFDESFRRVLRDVLPDAELRVLPVGHPLYQLGEHMDQVHYSPAARRAGADPTRPWLEFIEQDGRAVLIYSKYDLSSGIEGHPCYTCPSVLEPSAGKLVLKIILYGLSS